MEQTPAFVIGNAKTGKTNVIKNMLSILSTEKVYIFDNKSHELSAYQSRQNVIYAGEKSAIIETLNQILVTAELKVKKMTRSKFIEMLLASREVLILGNIKDQLLFSYTGVWEKTEK